MKLISVIVRPYKLDDVREALSAVGVQGLTFTEVEGFGRQKGQAELYRVRSTGSISYPKLRLRSPSKTLSWTTLSMQ